jgi:GGDEF domain-containing protein
MSIDRQLNDITLLLSNCLDAYTAALFVSDGSGKLLTLRAFHSLSKQLIPNVQFAPEDGGLVGWVAKNNQPLTVDHFDRDGKSLPYYQGEENIKSFLALPLEKRRGVLCVDSKRQYVFTNKDQKLLYGFATVMGNTLGGERVSHRQQLLRQLLTLWYRADALPADTDAPVPYLTRVLDSACPYLEADGGVVAVPIKQGEFLQPIALSGCVPAALLQSPRQVDQGFMGWVFKNRKSIIIPKFRSRTRIPSLFGPNDGIGNIGALIGMPLAWEPDEVGGVIAFICRKQARWGKEEISATTAVVRRVTLVLQNFTLKRELALLRNLDPITEVCNTEAFDRVLNKRLHSSLKAGAELGLGIIAIEGFEALATRVALPDLATLRQGIVETLLRHVKGKQLIGSLHLSCFAVLFENETSAQIYDQLTTITAAIDKEILAHLDSLSRLVARFGFAIFPQEAKTSHELWTMAFQALTNQKSKMQRRVAPGR